MPRYEASSVSNDTLCQLLALTDTEALNLAYWSIGCDPHFARQPARFFQS